MDEFYTKSGFVVVDRKGNKKRDLEIIVNEKRLKIEEKYREFDYGDFAIELIQDMNTNNSGWFFYTQADFIAYIIAEDKPIRVYYINWNKFKEYFLKNINRFKCFISRKGWGVTLNAEIKWKDIPQEFWKKKDIK